jgi:hypothetical protein
MKIKEEKETQKIYFISFRFITKMASPAEQTMSHTQHQLHHNSSQQQQQQQH